MSTRRRGGGVNLGGAAAAAGTAKAINKVALSSSPCATWAWPFLGLLGQSRAQWPVFLHLKQGVLGGLLGSRVAAAVVVSQLQLHEPLLLTEKKHALLALIESAGVGAGEPFFFLRSST